MLKHTGITVKVTAAHLRTAKRRQPGKDPVSLAICDATAHTYVLFVQRADVNYDSGIVALSEPGGTYYVPRSVDRFMSKWLNKKPVKPFQFKLIERVEL